MDIGAIGAITAGFALVRSNAGTLWNNAVASSTCASAAAVATAAWAMVPVLVLAHNTGKLSHWPHGPAALCVRAHDGFSHSWSRGRTFTAKWHYRNGGNDQVQHGTSKCAIFSLSYWGY
jgi:hypothetical protein